ncbi:hypothetical protein NED98_05645 [Sphingomonas sp. MMSM20]|uniref:hypothetical protein n=1 Tax=Sphingomonas lycopersici TaxID=2951807 RepID=UPI002238CAB8|nr:hypothetical protein [Sphingomonas lycopersici]MCW6529723.1 hypothetical protein [Sphingomonas lycopersici]
MRESYDTARNHRGVETSIAAAEMMAPLSSRLRWIVHKTLCANPTGLTVDETCTIAGYPRYSLQPRFTELRNLKMIRDTGQRRRNRSGAHAIVWRATILDQAGEAA